MIVSWFSAGVSSFVATHILRDKIDQILYCHIDDQHPDTLRFVHDSSALLGREISILRSALGSVENACRMRAAIKFVKWAPCTEYLKRRVRKEWEREQNGDLCYVWGFDIEERDRAERLVDAMPKQQHMFPLIEANLSKSDCHGYAARLGLKRPAMYDLGYSNNNCIGCIKGGMGYWNKIRVDFPDVFAARAKMERDIGHSCIKGVFLDELDPERGRNDPPILMDCGITCEIQLQKEGY